jgi:hypothetical protein
MDTSIKPNHLVMPESPSCPVDLSVTGLSAVPGPYSGAKTERYTIAEIQSILEAAKAASEMVKDIVLSNSLTAIEDNDTFVATVSTKPEDIILYTTKNNNLNLNNLDGGFI